MKTMTRRALVCLMSVGLVAAFAGTISGSIAWYAYSTRATASYSGTSVAESVQLQIGLVSSQDFTVDDDNNDLGFNLTIEDVEGQTYKYYWAEAGSGFNSAAIKAFLEKQGTYAVDELKPVTSRAYTGSSFSLYRSLIAGNTNYYAAETDAYSHIPFVFRIIDGNGDYALNADIWLTDATVAASGENERIREGIRIYFDQGSNDFILNPSSEATEVGYTKVAGPLDLNVDGVYDYSDTTEIMYGDYTNTPVVKGVYTGDNHLTDSTVFDDVNQTGQTAKSTFVAEHLKGNSYYDTAAVTACAPKTAKYETLSTIAPVDDGSGNLSGGKPLTRTNNDSTSGIARLDATIYLEGWDHVVIDQEVGHSFDLGLRFQINRV